MADAASQRRQIKFIMGLPGPVLRLMSGGKAVTVGGRTLDPRFQFLAYAARKMPGMHLATPEQARAASAGGLALMGGAREPRVTVESLTVPAPHGDLPARSYRPRDQDPAMPLLVFAHFGGGVIGDLDTCDAFCTILASIARCPVLSVEYRLAPEHKFPSGLDDVVAAYRWGRDNAARFGAPAGRAAIGGDSMGGNFAAVVCQDLRRAGEAQPELQLLIYPATDVASQHGSMSTYADAYPLTRDTMEWFMGHYMEAGADPKDPRLSPLREPKLAGLAPAIVVTAGFDPLNDQGEAYASALKRHGVPVVYRCYDSLAHGFTAFTGAVPAADLACREIAGLLREGLEGRLAAAA